MDQSFEDLYRILIAPIRSKLLLTGIELKVFNQLSEPKSADAVAQAIGTHPMNTSVLGLSGGDGSSAEEKWSVQKFAYDSGFSGGIQPNISGVSLRDAAYSELTREPD